MKHFFAYIFVLLLALLSAGCDVHEFPQPEPPAPENPEVTLHLEFDTSLEDFMKIEYAADGSLKTRSGAESDIHLRYIIQAYPDESRADEARTPLRSWTFTRVRPAMPDTTVSLRIPEGTARLLAWVDVSDGEGNDLHYITENFSEIKLPDRSNHEGATERRQAFRGDMRIVAGPTEMTMHLERPMAKYRFITNDFDRFISNVTRQRSGAADAPDRAVMLSDYMVRFVYPRYMACSLNMFTNRPADSWTGVTYTSSIRPLNDKEAEMGFDYVFVNTHETSVNVGLEVVERSTGDVVARIPSIEVPLSRSRLTTVWGPFLTTKTTGGAGINPDFDGDFNVLIE